MKTMVALIMALSVGILFGGMARADLNDGLAAYYRFNGDAVDESGQGSDGTVYGAVLTEDRFGRSGRAYLFDGQDDYIEIADGSGLDFGTGPFTLSVWIKTNAMTTAGTGRDDVLAKGEPTISGFSVSLQNNRAALMTGNSLELMGTTTLNDNEWHHIAGIRNATHGVFLYVDGQQENSGTNSEDVNVGSDLILGRHGVSVESFFDGSMDDIRIYNRALSEEEVLALYLMTRGDINKDGSTDLEDAITSLQLIVGLPHGTTVDLSEDVSGDDKIGMPEALYALQEVAGLYNRAPELEPIGNKTVDESSELTFTVSATDPEKDPLVYSATGLPEGAVFDPNTRVFSWTPTYAQSGTYPVIFTVSDTYRSDSETITITVNNRPASEEWTYTLDGGKGSGNLTVTEKQDGSITANGSWTYFYYGQRITDTFANAPVTVSGSSLSFTANGTATNHDVPPAYQTSAYTLEVDVTTDKGQASGTYHFTFSNPVWPRTFAGNVVATRTSGAGITR